MKIDFKTIIIALLVLVILYMGMCRSKPVPEKPIVKPVTEQQAEVTHDEDSINAIIDTLVSELQNKDEQLSDAKDELYAGQNKTKQLLSENAALRAKLTAGELTDNINDNADKLNAQIKKNDSLCNQNISLLQKKVFTKDKIISQKDNLYKKLKSNFDTCLKNQSALEKYSKQIKPTNKVALGLVSNIIPKFGVGFGADFIHKKGYVFSGSVMTMQKDYFVQVGFKKIISLKK
jgi:septal ring factor EnvC (AmiA/AmiB activator)